MRRSILVIISCVKLTAAPDRRQAILEVLRFVVGLTRVKPGCLDCEVYEAHGRSHDLLYIEQWQSDEDLSRHIRSDLYRSILSAMELSHVHPEVVFYGVSETKGIEVIERLRA